MPIRFRTASRANPTGDDDRSLLASFAATGDQAAFTRLVIRHGPLVLGVCKRILRDAHLADDAFQATFLVLSQKADRVEVGPSLANWLFGTARRVALAARRQQLRRTANTTPLPGDAVPERTSTTPDWDELLKLLDEELERLPDNLRVPVIECFYREKTQDEAAKELGWSLSTLRRRLEDAKVILRARLTNRGATLGAALIAGSFFASTATASVPLNLVQATVTVAGSIKTGTVVATSVAAMAQAVTASTVGLKVGISIVVLVGVLIGGVVQLTGENKIPVVPGVESNAVIEPAPMPRDFVPATLPMPREISPPNVDTNWVTLRGRVVVPQAFKSEPKRIEVTSDREHCLKDGELVYENIVINPKNRGLKNVIVWLRPDSTDRKDVFPRDRVHPTLTNAASRHHIIDQPCCQFVPRILAARAGDTLEIKNSATVPHNVNYSGETAFNITIPVGKSYQADNPLVAQSTPIPFKCDLHPWMAGRLRVFDHPYFAITDDDGNFEIKLAPAGNWRLVYWHEDGFHKGREGVLGDKITIGGPQVDLQPLTFEWPK